MIDNGNPARAAAVKSIRRMQAAWPAWRWSEEMEREYGTALIDVADSDLIDAGTTLAIREMGGKFPPPLADLLATVDYVRRQRAKDDEGRAAERIADEDAHTPVAQVWWSRLVKGALFASMGRRGDRFPVLEGHGEYLEIARRSGITPDDLVDFGPASAQHVKDAVSEAQALGTGRGHDQEAGRDELTPVLAMIGAKNGPAEPRDSHAARRGLRFVEAAYDHRDPPGTVRHVVVQPDGSRVPKGARIAGEV